MPPLTTPNVLIMTAIALAVFVAWHALLLFLASRLRPERAPDELYRTACDDGWALELARYKAPPREPGSPVLPPVICCHGVGANSISLDMAEEISLPRYLRARGFDVWLLDLRGRGASARPPEGKGAYDYSFDDHARHDVAAAIELVRKETGAPRVSWVGHSMGGMVVYAHAELHGDQDLQAVAVIGTPSGLGKKPRFSQGAAPLARFHALPAVYLMLASRVLAPTVGQAHKLSSFTRLLLNPANVDPRFMKVGMANVVANISRPVLLQLAAWTHQGKLTSVDGTWTYFERLGGITVPWLAIAGKGDRLVPHENVRAGWEKLGSRDKEWLLLSEENGHAADYGHCDMVMGPRCREEVYEPIARFLERHPLAPAAPALAAPAASAAAPSSPLAPAPSPVRAAAGSSA